VTGGDLKDFVRAELAAPTPAAVRAFARRLAQAHGAVAVLFYGSGLRTGDLGGVLDFYLLTRGPHRTGLRGAIERVLWPEVSYEELATPEGVLRAKVATMPLAIFRSAAEARRLDTTIWTRFVQPSVLPWALDAATAEEVAEAVAAAAGSAGSFAAALGPPRGRAGAFWEALFRQTYAAELRVERSGRADELLAANPGRYARLLPLAWRSQGAPFVADGEDLQPQLASRERRRRLARWRLCRLAGKPLNVARLLKAAFTFQGAARYAAWKIERHTGVHVAVTPWRERHPILAAPGVAWRLWRAKRDQAVAR
jgi:hypothetical protein